MAEDTKNAEGTEIKRGEGGRFLKGTKGGPGGPRKVSDAVLELLWDATPKAAQRIIEALDAMKTVVIPGGKGEPADHMEVDDWDTRLKAVNILWDRRYGKPVQTIASDEENPFELRVGSDLVESLKKLGEDKK